MRAAAEALALLALVGATLGACGRNPPGDPQGGFATAAALPFSATRDEVLAVGGRRLDTASVRRIVETMGLNPALAALDAAPGDRLRLRADGALCLAGAGDGSCRIVVADGRHYRLFDDAGRPHGSLTPSAG